MPGRERLISQRAKGFDMPVRWPPLFLALLLVTALAGCAVRPGPEVLSEVPAPAAGAKLVTVYVVTTRERAAPGGNVFTTGRAAAPNYAAFTISIPPGHRPGEIEWPLGAPDPARSFAIVQQSVLDRQTFERRIAAHGDRTRVGVFVHGFNQNFQEALFRLAQMSADADIAGVPILFAWPSEASFRGYVADREAVTFSRDALTGLLATLAQRRRADGVALVGHSMGGWLAVEALRQLRLTGRHAVLDRLDVVLSAPDIDTDVFRAQMAVIGRLPRPMVVLVSPDDRALSAASRIAGARPRIGTLDVGDPRVQEAALKANVQIVDISTLPASDPFRHDRYVNLATLYPRLRDSGAAGLEPRRAGAFIFDPLGLILGRAAAAPAPARP